MRIPVCLTTLALVAPLAAQTNAAVTVTAGNVTYTQGALPATAITTPVAAEVLNAGPADPLYQHWWFYRISGDTRQFTFAQDATATRSATNPTIMTTWPDVAARGVLSAMLMQTAVSTGAQSGYVREGMTVTNISAAPITVDLFAYTDYDVGGTANNARGNANSQVVQFTTPALSAEFFAVNPNATSVMAYATLRTNIIGTAAVYNLPGWTGTFGPGDYSGAYQWTIQLAPNASATVLAYLSVHAVRPQLANYGTGLAGSNGIPAISSTAFFVQDGIGARQGSIDLTNGKLNGVAARMLNFNQANLPIQGMTAYVDPAGASVTIAVANGSGQASLPLNVPPSPNFAGMNVFGQWFVFDNAAVNGLASHSGGLQIVVGHW